MEVHSLSNPRLSGGEDVNSKVCFMAFGISVNISSIEITTNVRTLTVRPRAKTSLYKSIT